MLVKKEIDLIMVKIIPYNGFYNLKTVILENLKLVILKTIYRLPVLRVGYLYIVF